MDGILGGGFPEPSFILLGGMSGTGKTTFAFQWLFGGVKLGENGLYISIIDSLQSAVRNIESMEFYDKKAIEQKKLILHDINVNLDYDELDAQTLLQLIEKFVVENNVKRLVIDPITTILHAIGENTKIIQFMISLKKSLSKHGCTVILISNVTEPTKYSANTLEEIVSDGIILLNYHTTENQIIRKMRVVKMRGTDFRSGIVTFDITQSGIVLYPKMPVDRSIATTEFATKIDTGIEKFNDICVGGFPEGHMIMLSGNTGSGKTTFALQFINKGLCDGDGAVYVALEESSAQIKKTAIEHDWDLDKFEKSGSLVFINPSLMNVYPDKILYEILNAINKTNAKRVIVDSISSLETTIVNKNDLREFFIQLTDFLKSRGVTGIMTYLSENTFGAELGQLLGKGPSNELRLSSIIDGIIILRYVERKQEVLKLMNILKMRGTRHDTRIWRFDVQKDGIKIVQAYNK